MFEIDVLTCPWCGGTVGAQEQRGIADRIVRSAWAGELRNEIRLRDGRAAQRVRNSVWVG